VPAVGYFPIPKIFSDEPSVFDFLSKSPPHQEIGKHDKLRYRAVLQPWSAMATMRRQQWTFEIDEIGEALLT
jgi:hypothetical protein